MYIKDVTDIQAGMLNKQITIQQNSPIADSYGQPIDNWSTYHTCHAAMLPLQGREYYQAQQVNAESTIEFVMRYKSGVTPKMRILFGTRTFNINSIINVQERNVWLIIKTAEIL